MDTAFTISSLFKVIVMEFTTRYKGSKQKFNWIKVAKSRKKFARLVNLVLKRKKSDNLKLKLAYKRTLL